MLGGFENYDRTDAVGRNAKLVRKITIGKTQCFCWHSVRAGDVTNQIDFCLPYMEDHAIVTRYARDLLVQPARAMQWSILGPDTGQRFARESPRPNILLYREKKAKAFDFWQVPLELSDSNNGWSSAICFPNGKWNIHSGPGLYSKIFPRIPRPFQR